MPCTWRSHMSSKLKLTITAAVASLLCHAAMAQTAAPVSRAEVKAETRAAEKAGKLVPAGEGPEFVVPKTSNTTRAKRKADTRAAEKAGEIPPAGDAEIAAQDQAIRAQKTTTNRAERKAQTRALEKSGGLTPAGEGPDAPKK
jgi:hypothetical protein